MAKPLRPMSEAYTPACCSVSESISHSSDAGLVDDDKAPIFSLSKSSMNVMSSGVASKRDPAWTRLDLRRSSSTNTHSEQEMVTLQPLQPPVWQRSNSHRTPVSSQSGDVHSPPALSERWISNMQRWSSSSSTHSRSSTPDTMVWKGSASRPCSLSQDISFPPSQDSPSSKLMSPPMTPSPILSPLHTPSSPNVNLFGRSSLHQSTQKLEESLESSPGYPHPPLPPRLSSPFRTSPPHHRLSSTNDGYMNNHALTFQFPSPVQSSDNLSEAEKLTSPRCLLSEETEPLASPREVSEGDGMTSPVPGLPWSRSIDSTASESPSVDQESKGEPVVGHLEVPGHLMHIFPTDQRRGQTLVSSVSDSQLESCCRCGRTQHGTTKASREEATLTSQHDLVDAAVQTITPVSSWWNIKRNLSSSNIGSPSILGSPPGSKLNLKSSIGSNSNLVSPSSSMFPGSSGEEDGGEEQQDPKWDVALNPLHPLERRRSCLKMHVEEKEEFGRRSSMKQVQWDEDGLTWDIHGAALDPEELGEAIQKHLELQKSPPKKRRSTKQKKAPQPPVGQSVFRAMTPERSMPSMIITAEGGDQEGEGGLKSPEEAPRRRSRAEADVVREGEAEDEVYGLLALKAQSQEGVQRKRGVMRSLRRPRWCGGSQKVHE